MKVGDRVMMTGDDGEPVEIVEQTRSNRYLVIDDRGGRWSLDVSLIRPMSSLEAMAEAVKQQQGE